MESPEKPGRYPGDGSATDRGFAPDPSWANQHRIARRGGEKGLRLLPLRTPMPSEFTPPVWKGLPPPPPPPEPALRGPRRWWKALKSVTRG